MNAINAFYGDAGRLLGYCSYVANLGRSLPFPEPEAGCRMAGQAAEELFLKACDLRARYGKSLAEPLYRAYHLLGDFEANGKSFARAWHALDSLAGEMRRWVRHLAIASQPPRVKVIGSPEHKAYATLRDGCPLDAAIGEAIERRLNREHSLLLEWQEAGRLKLVEEGEAKERNKGGRPRKYELSRAERMLGWWEEFRSLCQEPAHKPLRGIRRGSAEHCVEWLRRNKPKAKGLPRDARELDRLRRAARRKSGH